MMILKVQWRRWEQVRTSEGAEPEALVDEFNRFIECDEVTAHGRVEPDDVERAMEAWGAETYESMLHEHHWQTSDNRNGGSSLAGGRLLALKHEGKPTRWIVATAAWLMSLNGDTIERLV